MQTSISMATSILMERSSSLRLVVVGWANVSSSRVAEKLTLRPLPEDDVHYGRCEWTMSQLPAETVATSWDRPAIVHWLHPVDSQQYWAGKSSMPPMFFTDNLLTHHHPILAQMIHAYRAPCYSVAGPIEYVLNTI